MHTSIRLQSLGSVKTNYACYQPIITYNLIIRNSLRYFISSDSNIYFNLEYMSSICGAKYDLT